MVLLVIEDGDDMEVESWEDVARSQVTQLEEAEPGMEIEEDKTAACQKLDDGDCFAFEDRSSFDAPWRRIFALVSEKQMLLFDENGATLDEPENFTPRGKQPLFDDGAGVGYDGKDFASEWQAGYYRLPDADSLGAPPSPPPDGGKIPPALLEPGARIKMAFMGGSSGCVWHGGFIGPQKDWLGPGKPCVLVRDCLGLHRGRTSMHARVRVHAPTRACARAHVCRWASMMATSQSTRTRTCSSTTTRRGWIFCHLVLAA